MVKLPLQLASLIHGEEPGLVDEGFLPPEPDEKNASTTSNKNTSTQVVMASQTKFLRELQSYTRAVSMRLGFA